MRQLQITFNVSLNFTQPNDWSKFTLVGLYEANGRQYQHIYTEQDIPEHLAPKMAVLISAFVAMEEPWRVNHIHADKVRHGSHEETVNDETIEVPDYAIALTVWTKDDKGGNKKYTQAEYPEFILTQPEAMEIFDYFTQPLNQDN